MFDDFPDEFGFYGEDSIRCDECGEDVDVSGCTDPEDVLNRIMAHGKSEHEWGTEEAGLRHAISRFGELGVDCRDELELMSLSASEVELYGDRWGAALAHEGSTFTDVFQLSDSIVNTDDIINREGQTPTRFRHELVSAIEEAHTRGATVQRLSEEFASIIKLLSQQDTEEILRWAAKGGKYRNSSP